MTIRDVADAKAAAESAEDIWTRAALDADSKLILSYLVGGRGAGYFWSDVDYA